MNFRVGIGVDAHRIVAGRPLVLGGVRIAVPFGLEAHSDGDVISHAVLDAILGAANLGDKGKLFPATDPQYKDIRSTILLEHAGELLSTRGWRIGNIDISVVCEVPKIAAYSADMRRELSQALGIDEEAISLKATTLEGLGFTGRKEGIAATAVVLLEFIK